MSYGYAMAEDMKRGSAGLADVVLGADRAAREHRPEEAGDFRDDKGILHCGRCRAPLEYQISKRAIQELPSDASEEARAFHASISALLLGKPHRIMCKCLQAEREAYEKRKAQEDYRARLGDCFGPSLHLSNTTFARDDGRTPDVTDKLRRYSAKFRDMRAMGHGLILSGESGAGKSFYSVALLNELLSQGFRAVYTSVHKLHTMTSPYVTVQLVVNSMLDTDIIVVEDVNEDCFDAKNYATLMTVINASRACEIPIVITTRLAGEGLERIKKLAEKTSTIYIRSKV